MVNEDEGVLCAAPRLGVTERGVLGRAGPINIPLEVLRRSSCRMSRRCICSGRGSLFLERARSVSQRGRKVYLRGAKRRR